MKKTIFLFLILSLVLTLSVCPGSAEQDPVPEAPFAESADQTDKPELKTSEFYTVAGEMYPGPVYQYEILPDQTVRIAGYYGPVNYIYIPESIDGYPVSTIGKYAIPDNTEAYGIDIIIPDCVTVIEPNAFGNVHSRLTFVVSESHPTLQIKDNALICPEEKRIIRGWMSGAYSIPEGIQTLDDYAFWGCPFRSISIPESLTVVGQNPFALCNCSYDTRYALKEVVLSPDNPALELSDGILFSKDEHRLIWCYDGYGLDCMECTEYTIPDGIEAIDDFAFWRWSKLYCVTVPANVARIGTNPFPDAKIQLDDGNELFTVDNGLLISREERRIISGTASGFGPITVPEGTEIIGDYAFYCDHSQIILPDSIRMIGACALVGHNNVNIPAGVRKIGSGAFNACTGLTELPTFSDGVEFGACAFRMCNGIKRLVVDGGARIGYGAFNNCSGLEEIRIGNGNSYIGARAFMDCQALNSVELGEGLTSIGESAFLMCNSLNSVSLPASLRWIGGNALNNKPMVVQNEGFREITIFISTIHAMVVKETYAEEYCKQNDIEYTAR